MTKSLDASTDSVWIFSLEMRKGTCSITWDKSLGPNSGSPTSKPGGYVCGHLSSSCTCDPCSCCTIVFVCFCLPAAFFMNSSEWLLMKSALKRAWRPNACPFLYSDGSEGQPHLHTWLYALQKALVQRGKIMGRLPVQLPKYTSGTLNTVSVYSKIPWNGVSRQGKKHSLNLFNLNFEFESLDSTL